MWAACFQTSFSVLTVFLQVWVVLVVSEPCYILLMVTDDQSDEDTARREAATLKRLLATPPDHRRKVKSEASPKKSGDQAKISQMEPK